MHVCEEKALFSWVLLGAKVLTEEFAQVLMGGMGPGFISAATYTSAQGLCALTQRFD